MARPYSPSTVIVNMKSFSQFTNINDLQYGIPTVQQQKRMDKELVYFSDDLVDRIIDAGDPPCNCSEETRKELYYLDKVKKDKDLFDKYDQHFSWAFFEYAEENDLDHDPEELREIKRESSNVILHAKFHFNRPRPFQLATVYGLDFEHMNTESGQTPAYPSGHAAQARLLARILGDDNPEHAVALMEIADEVALSRELGGVHYPSDNEFGKKVGDMLFDDLRGIVSESTYAKSGLGKWFNQQSAGGGPGWDRYGTDGQKLGKCGDAEEGEPYSACLSKQKADKLGKEGIASFVRRKREAQKKAGDKSKGGEEKKGQKPVYVSTGAAESVQEGRPKDMGEFIENMKKKLQDAGIDLRKEHERTKIQDIIGSTATARLAHRGIINIKGGVTKEENEPTDPAKWEKALDKARSKFDTFPSAYASAWAAKEYKKMGGGWKSTK